ncbi:hypothetical protein T484DRAFT_1958604 [Baffinella frigidus]|nr:hypothetical protein T484DRAFT_1958604 [Cryptophyta sp. CCMP2293]
MLGGGERVRRQDDLAVFEHFERVPPRREHQRELVVPALRAPQRVLHPRVVPRTNEIHLPGSVLRHVPGKLEEHRDQPLVSVAAVEAADGLGQPALPAAYSIDESAEGQGEGAVERRPVEERSADQRCPQYALCRRPGAGSHPCCGPPANSPWFRPQRSEPQLLLSEVDSHLQPPPRSTTHRTGASPTDENSAGPRHTSSEDRVQDSG